MEVKLLTSAGSIQDMERFAAIAASTYRGNVYKDFVPSSEVLKRIIKVGHEGILEHIYLTYSVKDLSRACLQELARHRHITLSVESTHITLGVERMRCTLKKLLDTVTFVECNFDRVDFATRFVKFAASHSDMTNDELIYFLPEFWSTNLILTANVRELRHILKLRTAPEALKEFRTLAHKLFDVEPLQFKYLLQDCVQ